MKFRIWLMALVCVLLTACGAVSTQHAHRVGASPRCSGDNYAMSCALTAPPKASLSVPPLSASAPALAYGIDFAWSCPNPAGHAFGASYGSPDTSKNWTAACVSLYHSHGAATVSVYESSATEAARGYGAGFNDARFEARLLAALGAPAQQPFDMAIDFDAQGWQVASYFQGANAAEPGRVNAYGGYWPLLYLYQHRLVGNLNWQSYAWSGGLWLPASVAPLEQYLNSSAVDYDRALAANYAQWPFIPPKPPSPLLIFPKGPFSSPYGPLYERRIVAQYIGARMHPGTYAAYLTHNLEPRCHYLADRVAWLASHVWGTPKHPNWSQHDAGARFQYLIHAAQGRVLTFP